MGGGRKRVCEIERDTEKQKGMLREGARERTERQRKADTEKQEDRERNRDRGREGQCVC